MIDIHSHILPEIDDGSKDMEMSLSMARLYVQNGFERVIATSHYFGEGKGPQLEELGKSKSELEDMLDREGIDIRIELGNELYLSPDILESIRTGKALSLAGSRYVLIEMPANEVPEYTEDILYELQIKGYIPIIAHPERNSEIVRNPNILYTLIEKGSMAQLNLHSLTGMYGKDVMHTANTILKHNLIHFVGTDSHSNNRRSPLVKNSLKLLETRLGKERYFRIVYQNPELMIQDKVINKLNPEPVVRRGLLNGLMNGLLSIG
jgi:protein-tyrosine phosphatase